MTKPDPHSKVIYQYKLLKRVKRHPAMVGLYVGLLISFGVVLHVFGFAGIWLWMLGALCGWQLVYIPIVAALLHREAESAAYIERYHFLFGLPWFGYLPRSSVPFRVFRLIHWHVLFVGFVFTACLWRWLPLEGAAGVGFIHLWSMLPHFYVLALLRSADSSGSVILFGSNEVNVYSP